MNLEHAPQPSGDNIMIDHTFIFDWRHMAAPFALTTLVVLIAVAIAYR